MGANQSSGGGGSNAPVGTNFKAVQKDRQKYGDVDMLDIIPLNKLKEAGAEIDMTVKQSKFLVEYKREFRDALKRKRAKGHEPKMMRLYTKSMIPADDAVGKNDSRKGLIHSLTENITPVVKDDVVDGLKEEKKAEDEKTLAKLADEVIFKLIHERVHDRIHDNATRIFRKFQQGQDFTASDDEEDPAADEEARAERARLAAKQREYDAEVWLAEMNGEEPPEPPADEEEEEEEEDEE